METILFHLFLILAPVPILAFIALLLFFNDESIFGEKIARKNRYHTIRSMVIFWIYLSVSCEFQLNFLNLKQSELVNSIVALLFMSMPIFTSQVISRIGSRLYGQKRVGDRINNFRLGLQPDDRKFSMFFTLVPWTWVVLEQFLDFPANSRTDLRLLYLILSGLWILTLILPLLDKLEIRERGIYDGSFAIQWDEIEAYKFEHKRNMLHIQHKSAWPILKHLEFYIPEDKKAEILSLLKSYLFKKKFKLTQR
jgi:hypothetical protein